MPWCIIASQKHLVWYVRNSLNLRRYVFGKNSLFHRILGYCFCLVKALWKTLAEEKVNLTLSSIPMNGFGFRWLKIKYITNLQPMRYYYHLWNIDSLRIFLYISDKSFLNFWILFSCLVKCPYCQESFCNFGTPNIFEMTCTTRMVMSECVPIAFR